MDSHSIMAGKTYRTSDETLRRVLRVEGDDVIFNEVSATPGYIARHDELSLPIAQFATEADGEL